MNMKCTLYTMRFFIVIILLTGNLAVLGQDTLSIKVIANAHKDSISLRWAPASAVSWKLLNQYGYRIERYTIMRDSLLLQEKPKKILIEQVKPASQHHWEKFMNDDYVAVAAQAIYGQSFETSNKKQTDITQLIQKSKDIEMRYSFTLLAADVSPTAAELSGLMFVDKEIKANESYLYRVYSLIPDNILKINFGYTFLSPMQVKVLPTPGMPEIRRLEKTAVLRWETYTLIETYTGYFVERSLDGGKTYSRITKLPIVNIITAEDRKMGNAFSVKSDSINGVIDPAKIFYTIRGVTAFGEIGPPSQKVGIATEKPLGSTPAITKAKVIDNSSVELKWTFPEEHQEELKGYQIERRLRTDQEYQIINELVMPEMRSFTDKNPSSTNYYRIVAFTPQGQKRASFPYLVQLEDSIPPLPPQKLVGSIDTAGVVVLKWEKNKEVDLVGYRVFRSNFKNSEFGQVTVSPVELNMYYDTVNVKTLTSSVWYKVQATDNRFNPSDFSEMIEIKLPDVIPPVPPVIQAVKSTETGIEIRWTRSPSRDVVRHDVYRRNQASTAWQLVKSYTKEDSCCYLFDKITEQGRYQYAFLAMDDNGLKSPMTKPVWASPLPVRAHASIKNIRSSVDREKKIITLQWNYKLTPAKFLVYRSTNNEPISLYKTIDGNTTKFEDTSLVFTLIYHYRIKAVFRDGSESVFSDKITVEY